MSVRNSLTGSFFVTANVLMRSPDKRRLIALSVRVFEDFFYDGAEKREESISLRQMTLNNEIDVLKIPRLLSFYVLSWIQLFVQAFFLGKIFKISSYSYVNSKKLDILRKFL